LVVVGWVLWAQLATSIVLEAAAYARIPRLRTRRVPGLGATRALAALLIGWVLTMFASPAAAGIAAPAVPVTSVLLAPVPQAHPDEARPDERIHIVAARETLWEIAERELGDPLRWREILALNEGRPQPDGTFLADGSVLHVGWRLVLPSDAPTEVRVEAGDTLSELAGQFLGDPRRYPQIYERNHGVRQPDGGALADPDLIRPGWLLTLPESGDGVGSPGALPEPPGTIALEPEPPVPTQPPASTSPAVPPTSPTAPSVPNPVPHSPTDPPVAEATPPAADVSIAVTILGSGLAASGIVASLLLYRRRQQRWRRTGRQVALPDLHHSRIEAAAVAAAGTAGPGLLDLALRSLAIRSASGGGLPSVEAVWLAPDGVELVLCEPLQAEPPFAAEDDGAVWRLDADAALPITEQDAVAIANPYPALVSVGTGGDDSVLLLDLEHAGAIHLVGDGDRAVDLLRNMAVELGTSRWADGTAIRAVGLEASLAHLPPKRLEHYTSLDIAIAEQRREIAETSDQLGRLDEASILQMRVDDQLSDAWVVAVLLVANPDNAQTQMLRQLCDELLERARIAAAVVTANAPAELPGVQVQLRPDGTVVVPHVETTALRAEQMPAQLADGLLSVIGTATKADVVPDQARESQLWARDMRVDGSLMEATDNAANTPPEDPATPSAEAESALDETEKECEPVDPAAQRRLLLVERQDATLDDDLAAWQDTAQPTRPMIAILGEPALRAPGIAPEKRKSWYVEVAVYLALHPLGVDRDKLTTDLWPEGRAVQPPTIRRAVAEVRAWAGKDASSEPPIDFVPSISPAGGDRYRITGHLTDWDLFRRLRKRAQARAAAGRRSPAMVDYESALSLVRGPVLHPLRPKGYAWLHNPDQRHEHLIPGFVIDTAHELVDLALQDGDLELARFAAETARRVDPDRTSDRPFTDLMRIAHAAGDYAEMREHAELLLAERGFEVGEDLPPESFAVFNELLPRGLRTSG
jgi:hypothetical protein